METIHLIASQVSIEMLQNLKRAKNIPNINILLITQGRLLNYPSVIYTYVCNNEYICCHLFICMWHIFNRGADLAALVREASICALRTVMKSFHKGGQPVIVNKSHFDEAFVRVKPSVQAKVKINDHEKWFSFFSETVWVKTWFWVFSLIGKRKVCQNGGKDEKLKILIIKYNGFNGCNDILSIRYHNQCPVCYESRKDSNATLIYVYVYSGDMQLTVGCFYNVSFMYIYIIKDMAITTESCDVAPFLTVV